MRKIDVSTPTFPNTFALVDDEDYERINKWKWYAVKREDRIYAAKGGSDKPSERGYMHREILKTEEKIDHKDRDGLNNQKFNPRPANKSQNNWNSRKPRNNSSGFVGVCFDKVTGKWMAYVAAHGKRTFLGRFSAAETAARVRDAEAKKLHGEYARLNFP